MFSHAERTSANTLAYSDQYPVQLNTWNFNENYPIVIKIASNEVRSGLASKGNIVINRANNDLLEIVKGCTPFD